MLHTIPAAYRTPSGTVYKPCLHMAERPHLLVAGATGSGKSVALNGIIHSLLMTQSPFNCQFVLIDPKKVELVQYECLPHTARYASDHPDIVRALQWAEEETDRRFSVMQKQHRKEYDGPHLYVIIDELARGAVQEETVSRFARLVEDGAEHGVDAIIVGCPELQLLVDRLELGIPIVDVLGVHVRALVDVMLGEDLS